MGDWRAYVYGGIASCIAEGGTFPIDTSKTRLQIQGQVIEKNLQQLKYRGMFHALITITKEEGFRALYNGFAPAVLRQASYGTIKIGLYYNLKPMFITNPQESSLFRNILCGGIAGVVSSSVANPTDVLKIRMQARHESSHNVGMMRAFYNIGKHEGIRGLWRGVGPTSARAAVMAGVQLPAYDEAKRMLLKTGYFGEDVRTHLSSSFMAGICATIATNPIDVTKTRMMNQRKLKTADANQRIYKNAFECVYFTVKHEGPLALYKGFNANWLRVGPWNCIFFVAYEQMKKMY